MIMNKLRLKVLLIAIYTLFVWTNASAQSSSKVKWHPGHYMLVNGNSDKEDYLKGNFLGIQKKYSWRSFEKTKGVYDFSEIRNDLEYLQKNGKRLVIQLQTKSAPSYLNEKEYGGGFYRTSTGSLDPVYWNEKVEDRIISLYKAIGKEFNNEPYLEAVGLPETAISSDLKNGVQQDGVEEYTPQKYGEALCRQMKVLKDAFPSTVVIQYTNFPKEAIKQIISFQMENGIGLGGPDVNLYSNLNDPKTGVYQYYDQVQGQIPLGAAVQSADYSYDNPRHPVKIPALPTIELIYKFGRDRLHLNYMFWLDRPKYIEQVLDFMKSNGFPKNATGGLEVKLPSCYK